MNHQTQIVSTKKLLPNQKQFLLNADLSVIEADFIKISLNQVSIPDADYLIFTSSNAVRSVLQNPELNRIQKIPCYCVGEKTSKLLIENGFHVEASADYADILVKTLVQKTTAKFAFICGNIRLNTIPDALTSNSIIFTEITAYQTKLDPIAINAEPNGILFFSPSAVESYLVNNSIGNSVCFCIGTTTAKALENSCNTIVIAQKPTIENTIIRAIKYFNELNQTSHTKLI